MKTLIIGANGQIGWELTRTLCTTGDVITTTRDGSSDIHLDLTELDELERLLERIRPDVIVNAAAYTAVDRAEEQQDLARTVNTQTPATIGTWAARNDVQVIHYSTDYVYDGMKSTPYVETDPTNPLGTYGRTKLAGDEALLDTGANTIILRVSWVYGRRGGNFLLTMQRLMQERDALRIVDDQVGAPTWCRLVAQATATVIARLPTGHAERQALSGVYHLAPTGHTSWYGFAEAIRSELDLECALEAIPSSEYPTPAPRPLNSRMATDKLRETFGIELPSWDESLRLCLG